MNTIYHKLREITRYTDHAHNTTKRKDRREAVALNEIKGLSDAAQARFSKVSQRIKEKERTYEDFCRQTGLATQKERLRVVGYNRSVSAKVRWAERKNKQQIS